MMKTIVSMILVLAAASLLSSQTQAGYADGMNQYAAYHVMHGGLDPRGTDTLKLSTPEQVNDDGTIVYGPFLGPTHVWQITIPEAENGGCLSFETELVEYEFTWASEDSTVPGSKVNGGYHVTVQGGGVDSYKEEWRINLGRGTGYVRNWTSLVDEARQVNNLTEQESTITFQEMRPYAEDIYEERVSARQILNSKGTASYRVTLWCICTELLEFEGFREPQRIPRAQTEVATETTLPARFLSIGDWDPRQHNPWHMGDPNVRRGLYSVGEATGSIVWDFGDPARENEARVE